MVAATELEMKTTKLALEEAREDYEGKKKKYDDEITEAKLATRPWEMGWFLLHKLIAKLKDGAPPAPAGALVIEGWMAKVTPPHQLRAGREPGPGAGERGRPE
jgi:hypothetical protein